MPPKKNQRASSADRRNVPQKVSSHGKSRQWQGIVGIIALAMVVSKLATKDDEPSIVGAARRQQPLEARDILVALQQCYPSDGCASLSNTLAEMLPLNLPKVAVESDVALKLDLALAVTLINNASHVRADAFHDVAVQSASRLPSFQQAWSLAHSASRGFDTDLEMVRALGQLETSAIVALLTRIRVSPNSESWEVFFRRARAALLHIAVKSPENLLGKAIHVAAAFACQASKTEWMWAVSAEETRQLATLSGSPVFEIRSMYGPLLTDDAFRNLSIDDAKLLLGRHHVLQDSLLKQLVLDPLEERHLAANLPVIAAPQENISVIVQSMYEADPYPRWDSLPTPDWPHSLDGFMQKAAGATPGSLPSQPNAVLILGCGTGHWASGFARHYPHIKIDAVDLSSSSLGFAARKASELSLTNLKLAKADLLGLHVANNSFDLIESSGVLHHLRDPQQGLAVVARLLRPGGIALLALYSRVARRPLDRVQSWRKHSAPGRPYDPSKHEDLRRFRQDVFAIESNSPWHDIKKWLVATGDFWSLSRLRDLVFHPVEHRYSPSQLERLMDRHGLDFLRFAPWSISSDKRKRWRAKYGHGSEPSTDRNLSRWDAFELEYPDTFQGMLVFFAQKRHV